MLRRRAAPRSSTPTTTPRPIETAPSTTREVSTALASLGGATASAATLILAARNVGGLPGTDAALLDVQALAVDDVWVGGYGGVVGFGGLEVDEGTVLVSRSA